MAKAHFYNIESALLKAINETEYSLRVAVAWFVNKTLFNALLNALSRGVKVEIVLLNDPINNRPGGLTFQRLIDSKAEFYFAKGKKLMHHKFCISDGVKVFTGSYNWTYAAERNNEENVLEIAEKSIATSYANQFEALKNVCDPVTDITHYLSLNPPSSTLNENLIISNEVIGLFEDNGLNDDVIAGMQFVDEAYRVNDLHVEKMRAAYKDFAKSLKEFCIRYPRILIFQIVRNYQWTLPLFKKYKRTFKPGELWSNHVTIWNMPLLREFNAMPYSDYQYLDKRNLYLSLADLPVVSYEFFRSYQMEKELHPDYDDSLRDRSEPFFPFRAFDDYEQRDTGVNPAGRLQMQLNYNDDNYPWQPGELIQAADEIDFWFTHSSDQIVWKRELLLKVKALRPHQYEFFLRSIKLDQEQLIAYKDILNWKGIALNTRIVWSLELFEQFKEELLNNVAEFCQNSSFPWTVNFIYEYADQLDFRSLSGNEGVPFTEKLILDFKDKWWFYGNIIYKSISSNKSVRWNAYLMEVFCEQLNWLDVAENPSAEWTINLIERYIPRNEPDYYITKLAYNPGVWKAIFEKVLSDKLLLEIEPHIPDEKDILKN